MNRNDIVIRFNALKYYLPKAIIKYNNIIIHGKKIFEQAINSDIKKYEEIGELTTGQVEGYTAGWMFIRL